MNQAEQDQKDNAKIRTFFHAVQHAKQVYQQSPSQMAFVVVSRLLREVVPCEETSWVLVAYLRGSSPIREHIPTWDSLFRKTETTLTMRGENAKQVLRGLYLQENK